jgi:hypothetical protein
LGGGRSLDEDMLSILQGGFGKFIMRPHRSFDSDGIDFRRGHELSTLRDNFDVRVSLVNDAGIPGGLVREGSRDRPDSFSESSGVVRGVPAV